VYRKKDESSLGIKGQERSKDGLDHLCALDYSTSTPILSKVVYVPNAPLVGLPMLPHLFISYTSNPRNIHSRTLKDIVA
jgi:hypothetical protein